MIKSYPNVHHVSRTYFDDYHDIYYNRHRCLSIISVNPCVYYKVQTLNITHFYCEYEIRQNTFRATRTLAEWYVGVHEDTHRKTFLDSFFFQFFMSSFLQ